jgi:hypothetical protein
MMKKSNGLESRDLPVITEVIRDWIPLHPDIFTYLIAFPGSPVWINCTGIHLAGAV